MGRASKRKGYEGEREFAELINGKRVPLSGAMEGYECDVTLPNGWMAEVKRRKTGLKTMYNWLIEDEDDPEIVAFRADRMPWLITMEIDQFKYLLECEEKLKKLEGGEDGR